jgi:hypothetical protein
LHAQSRNLLLLAVVVLVTLAGILWGSYRIAVDYPGGDHFVGIWSGMRGFLSEGFSPYSVQVRSQISTTVAGWEASPQPGRSLFNFPFYILLPTLPVAVIGEYTPARSVWISLLVVAVIGLVLTARRLAGWRTRALPFIVALVFALLNPYTITAVITGDFSIITALLAALALLAIKNDLDELAGLLLAISTVTPQLVLPLIGFISLWAFSNRRDRLVLWTYGGLGLLVGGSWLIQRDWIEGYIQATGRYYALEGIFTPGAALHAWLPGFGAQMGWALTAALGLLLLVEWRLATGKGFRWFLWTACLTLAIGGLLGLRIDPGNLVVVLAPLLLIIGIWDERWGGHYGWSSALVLTLLFLALWALIPRNIEAIAYPGINPVLFFALPVFTIVGLYWVRWLAVRPRGTVMDELRKRGEF